MHGEKWIFDEKMKWRDHFYLKNNSQEMLISQLLFSGM
jgi:hypothetical protein